MKDPITRLRDSHKYRGKRNLGYLATCIAMDLSLTSIALGGVFLGIGYHSHDLGLGIWLIVGGVGGLTLSSFELVENFPSPPEGEK